jgi:hypothetical protein
LSRLGERPLLIVSRLLNFEKSHWLPRENTLKNTPPGYTKRLLP